MHPVCRTSLPMCPSLQGQARAIGVSNFGIAHLQKLAQTATIKPAVNQIELHPWLQASRRQQGRVCHARRGCNTLAVAGRCWIDQAAGGLSLSPLPTPWLQRRELVDFCRQQGMVVEESGRAADGAGLGWTGMMVERAAAAQRCCCACSWEPMGQVILRGSDATPVWLLAGDCARIALAPNPLAACRPTPPWPRHRSCRT